MGLHPGDADDVLQDSYGRSFPYLRLSITDVCNFKCSYCLPNGYQGNARAGFLGADEIDRLVAAFSELGTYKIRLTGGEPTVRRDFTDIARRISARPGITQLAFTTNGYRLKDKAQDWRDAGLTHINISIDSLDRDIFHRLTGRDKLDDVLAGITAAQKASFTQIKINAVLLKGINDRALPDMLALAKGPGLSIRFLELMQTGDNLDYFKTHHVSCDGLRDHLRAAGWQEKPRNIAAGPAQVFTHKDYAGSIGLIAPYAKDFCKGCNRLRVTAMGDLRLCLFGEVGISLRGLLQSDDQKSELKRLISKQLAHKAASHYLLDGKTGIMTNLSTTGG